MPPVGSINPNVGGTSLLEASVELRFPIWRKIGGVLFVDTGVLDLEPFSYPLDKLYWAVGPGLRYDTIVGPLRLDFGALLNPRRRDREQFQWFISVGQSF
jgi:outer membrane translocation and assembly module TamA